MSFYVVLTSSHTTIQLALCDKNRVPRTFTTKKKAQRAADRVTGGVVSTVVHKTDLHKWSVANV